MIEMTEERLVEAVLHQVRGELFNAIGTKPRQTLSSGARGCSAAERKKCLNWAPLPASPASGVRQFVSVSASGLAELTMSGDD